MNPALLLVLWAGIVVAAITARAAAHTLPTRSAPRCIPHALRIRTETLVVATGYLSALFLTWEFL